VKEDGSAEPIFQEGSTRPERIANGMQNVKKARVIAIANGKGGIGKTTTTAVLGTQLSMLGCRVLVIDNDPQANLSSVLGYTGYTGPNLYNVLLEEATLRECLLKTAIDPETMQYFNPLKFPERKAQPGPMLVPITSAARQADFELKSKIDVWVYQLRDALQTIMEDFDYILIDCSPSLGTLTVNAFNAAQDVLIPMLPERLVAEGLADLIGAVATVRRKTNTTLQIAGLFFSMVLQNWRAHNDVKDSLRTPATQQGLTKVLGPDAPPLHVFHAEIKHNASLANSTNEGSLLVVDSPKSPYTKAYWLLLAEIIEVIGGTAQAKTRQVAANIQAGK
jgi:chromosome partitioning protein